MIDAKDKAATQFAKYDKVLLDLMDNVASIENLGDTDEANAYAANLDE